MKNLDKCQREFEKEHQKACKDFHSGCSLERSKKDQGNRLEVAERFTMLCEELRGKNAEENPTP